MKNLIILTLVLVSTTTFAQHFELNSKILSAKTIHNIIGDYPKAGSVAEAADFKILQGYQSTRTEEDCKFAEQDADLSLTTLFGGEKGILSKDELKKMNAFLVKAYANVWVNSTSAKKLYKRPRPYEQNFGIKPCIGLEKSYAYPSGHTLMARLFARILSKVYPERAEKFLVRSAEYSLNRVIGGVHHPSDLSAAFILADYLAVEMIDNDDFVNELTSL
jgi:acid phosphatase (class A)